MYTPEKVRTVLDTLAEEAPLMMLFLKSVERLEVLDWPPGSPAPLLVFECCVQVGLIYSGGFRATIRAV